MALALHLRTATREWHARAERAGVMGALLRGDLPLRSYQSLLRNLHAVYAALEPALARHREAPALAPLWDDRLARLPALTADLDALDPDWRGQPLATVARHYAERLADLDAERLVAHAYTRYLGDLSGGQVLRRLVAGRYGIAGPDGLRFYDFGGPNAVAALAQGFRVALDRLPVGAAGAARIADEACRAFRLHAELFDELAQEPVPP